MNIYPFIDATANIEMSVHRIGKAGWTTWRMTHYYLQTNPGGPGALHLMEDRQDSTIYSQQHRRYHASFRDLVERFGFSDLMLIDHQGERIIYSARKGPHLGTSLKTGPFRSSSL